MKRKIYADNAATTVLDEEAYEKMQMYLKYQYANASQPYSFADASKVALCEARKMIADCIGASPQEIFFTSGGTESDNWAIKGFSALHEYNCTIIASNIEHHAVLKSCLAVEKAGCEVYYLSADKNCTVNSVSPRLKAPTLVSVMTANNETGVIQPIEELCRQSHEYGAVFHTDAVQAVGHIHINVKKTNVDLLSASSHKFGGPRGTGFLYIKNGVNLSSLLDGGAQEKGRRAGTENLASVIGMAYALRNSCNCIEKNKKRLEIIESHLLGKLRAGGVDFIHNTGSRKLPGLLSLSFCDKNGEAIMFRLDMMGVSVSTGAACNGNSTDVSHVLDAMDVPRRYADGTVRVSFGANNTLDDAEFIASAIIKIMDEK